DLLELPALRCDVACTPLVVRALELLVGNADPACVLARNKRKDDQLAELGRAELGLALFEIFGEHLRRRRRDLAGLGAVKQHIVDRALFVVVAVRGLDLGLRNDRRSDHRVNELPTQHPAALLGNVTSFGEATLAQQYFEALPVELAVRSLEGRVLPDAA